MVTIKPRAPRVHAWSTTPGDSRAAAFVEAPPGSNEWFLALADVDKDAKSAESTLVRTPLLTRDRFGKSDWLMNEPPSSFSTRRRPDLSPPAFPEFC